MMIPLPPAGSEAAKDGSGIEATRQLNKANVYQVALHCVGSSFGHGCMHLTFYGVLRRSMILMAGAHRPYAAPLLGKSTSSI